MANDSLQTDEFALGVLGLVFSVAFLKANELFEFFDRTDVFQLQGQTLIIRGREFLALLGFAGAYIVFLAVAVIGTALIAKRQIATRTRGSGRTQTLLILSAVLIVLFVAHFFSFAAAYSHAMHKYNDMIRQSEQRIWDFRS